MEKASVIIPTYKPDSNLTILTEKLFEDGFTNIIVVDDGSGEEYSGIFDETKCKGATVISLHENQGKGNAIKAGLLEILKKHPDIIGVITADCDGQHSAEDISQAARLLCENPHSVILGERNMKDKSIPLRLRLRNRLTSFLCRIDTGKSFKDSQTGLRAIPYEYIPFAINVEGKRFEYESNFLADVSKKNIPVKSFEISALFPEGNKTYYKSVKDSARVMSRQLRFTMSSLSFSALDIILFSAFKAMFNTRDPHHVFLSGISARIISGVLNFVVNKKIIFKDSGLIGKQFLKYVAFFIFQMLLSSTAVTMFSSVNVHLELVKICVDTLLFILSYFVQRRWIFK